MIVKRPLFAFALLALAGCDRSAASVSAGPAKAGCTDNSRSCIELVAKSYIDALISHDGSKIPLSDNVRRTENALTNAKGPTEVRESFARTGMVEGARDLRMYVDERGGEVVVLFLLDVDLKDSNGGGSATTKAGNTEYKVAVTKPAGTYTVHEAERFKIVNGKITQIEIIAHVEDGKGLGAGWPDERDAAVKSKAGK